MIITASILKNGTAKKLASLPLAFQREAIPEILRRITDVTYFIIFKNLSGSGSAEAGSKPVPIRTGNLRRRLKKLYPGQKNSSLNEAFVIDSARYADVIPQFPWYQESAVDETRNNAIAEHVIKRLVNF